MTADDCGVGSTDTFAFVVDPDKLVDADALTAVIGGFVLTALRVSLACSADH